MWENISNSSIIFSRNFYKQKESNIYKNNVFINKLYNYFVNQGYFNIISKQIINILISTFLISYMIFLINCINYRKIITLDNHEYIHNFIELNNFFNMNMFLWVSSIIFMLFTLVNIISIFEDIIVYNHIKNYYNKTLGINDIDLKYLKWESIIQKINENSNDDINIFYLNNIINSKNNLLINLFDNNIIKLNHLTSIMEWNLIYCILFSIFDNNFKFKKDIFSKKQKLVDSIIYRIKVISIINFILMPFILTFIFFYNIFNYGEEYYNNPSLIFSRIFSRKAYWKIRYYNELDHEFNERINKAIIVSSKYANLFSNVLLDSLLRLVVFICSSVFIVLAILSLVNDKILIYLLITKNQSVLWLLGLLVSIIALSRKKNKIEDPKEVMEEITKYIIVEDDIKNNPNIVKYKNKFLKMFQYKLIEICKDIVYTIISPFELWLLSFNIDNVIDHIEDNIESHYELEYIFSPSNLEKIYLLNDEYDYTINDAKTIDSLIYFKKKYNEWTGNMNNNIYGFNKNVNINVIN